MRTNQLKTMLTVLACGFSMTGCMAYDDLEVEVASVDQAIKEGAPVSSGSLFWRSTVALTRAGRRYCTGTIIANQFVLSAAHCTPQVGDQVRFFNGSTPTSLTRTVTNVYYPDGVNPYEDDLEPGGKYSDLSVLKLSSTIPSGYQAALLPDYPSDAHTHDDQWGNSVGCGGHDSNDSAPLELRQRAVKILRVDESTSSSDAGFYVSEHSTDGGDSGGPFMVETSGRVKVVGTLWGYRFRPISGGLRSYYTVVRDHIPFIQSALAGTRPASILYERTHEACSTTVTFQGTTWNPQLIRNTSAHIHFDVASGEIKWWCGSSAERTGCPAGTNFLEVYRDSNGSRGFNVECRRVN